MTAALLTLLTLAVLAFCVYREKTMAAERAEWAVERATLIQRIQAPAVAITKEAQREAGDRERPRMVPADDDRGFLRAKGLLPAEDEPAPEGLNNGRG